MAYYILSSEPPDHFKIHVQYIDGNTVKIVKETSSDLSYLALGTILELERMMYLKRYRLLGINQKWQPILKKSRVKLIKV